MLKNSKSQNKNQSIEVKANVIGIAYTNVSDFVAETGDSPSFTGFVYGINNANV